MQPVRRASNLPAGAPRGAPRAGGDVAMHKVSLVVLALVALLAPAALPASAQTREFTGKVDKISKSELIVDNRMGDKVKFEKLDSTTVEGEKKEWKSVKKNDWVTVHWKMIDKPRKAYKVVVLPPRTEAGEDVE
jgi:hypothetical protein